MSKDMDVFNGDNEALVRSAQALLNLDEDGVLVTGDGIGKHARIIIKAFIARMDLGQQAPAEQEARDWEMKAQGIESVIHCVVSKHDQDVLRRYAEDMRSEGNRLAAHQAREQSNG